MTDIAPRVDNRSRDHVRSAHPTAVRLMAGLILLAVTSHLATPALAQTAAPSVTPPAAPSAALPAPLQAAPEPPFAERFNKLANGIDARKISVPSSNPANYEDIIARRPAPQVVLEAMLYLPKSASAPSPAVIITPGSGGVNPAMLEHARALTDAGIAVLLVDPFGGRGVRDTIAAQTQFSFAASTYDIFAAMRALSNDPAIDTARVGAMGYSRGGISVLQAAVTSLSRAALGDIKPLRAVFAGWSWCGYQFDAPDTAPTSVRFVSADSDDYVSTVQCQSYAAAMRFRNPDVSIRLVRDARHGFGYGAPLMERPQAIKALTAPIIYFDATGILQDPWSAKPLPGTDDKQILKMMLPFVSRGVNVGSKDGQKDDFIADFVAYFTAKLARP